MRQAGSAWTFVAPDAATIAAMGMPADAPVPIEVVMTFPHAEKAVEVKKTVWIGTPAPNPDMPPVTVDGAAPGDTIVVARDQDVYFATTVPAGWHVNWLTSAGTLHQDDEPTSYLHIAAKDRQTGELACVIRDDHGGVVWKVWPLHTQ